MNDVNDYKESGCPIPLPKEIQQAFVERGINVALLIAITDEGSQVVYDGVGDSADTDMTPVKKLDTPELTIQRARGSHYVVECNRYGCFKKPLRH